MSNYQYRTYDSDGAAVYTSASQGHTDLTAVMFHADGHLLDPVAELATISIVNPNGVHRETVYTKNKNAADSPIWERTS